MRVNLRRAYPTAALTIIIWAATTCAWAGGLTITEDAVEAKAASQHSGGGHDSEPDNASGPSGPVDTDGESNYTYLPKSKYKTQISAYKVELAAAVAANQQARAAFARCLDTVGTTSCARFQEAALPGDPNIRPAGNPADPAAPAVPAITPEQAAYIASARIRLTPPKPMFGPSPDLNEWKMAAVGYPLWLWAAGNLDPAPVADSVQDISVALDARLVKVVFNMGDGRKVTCTDLGTRWTRAVEPGRVSPSCGYAYAKPSLPQGSYTVTANAVWAIDWSINGTTGSIPFFQSASTTIPVGELQVLVR